MTRHECPVPGCRVMLPRARLMCRPHWYAVPTELRLRLNDAWTAARWAEYLELRTQAIDAAAAKAEAR
jgi:hypothetical protein